MGEEKGRDWEEGRERERLGGGKAEIRRREGRCNDWGPTHHTCCTAYGYAPASREC